MKFIIYNKSRFLSMLFFILIYSIAFATSDLDSSIFAKDINGIMNAVSEIYHVDLDEVEITPLKGGFSGDRLYKVIQGEKISVIRIHKSSKSFDRKKLEYLCTQIAFDLDLGPKVLYVNKTFDVMMTDFAKGKHPDTETFNDPIMIKTLAKSLKKLHDGPTFILSWDVFHDVRKWVPKKLDDDMKLALIQLDKIEKELKKANLPSKPSHNDIQPDNLFVDGKKISFIDWGDAGQGDPYYDLARASLMFDFNSKQDEEFFSNYMEGAITELARSRLFLMKQVFMLRWAFWAASQNAVIDKNKLQLVIKIFKEQDYILPTKGENKVVRWNDISKHALKLFLQKTNSKAFDKALDEINKNAIVILKNNVLSPSCL